MLQRIFNPERLQLLQDYLLIVVGTAVQAVSMHLFFIPSKLAAGGLSGAAQIINNYTGWPIGVMVLVGNIPLFFIGWKYLGGRRFLTRTIFGAVCYSIFLDSLHFFLPRGGLTDDFLLNALYGGIVGGVGAGLVFRAKATSGGTDILARFMDRRWGIPLSQSYLYTDGLVVFLAALAFSWEHALYAVVALYIGGVVMEVTTSGLNVDRVATIVTQMPEAVASGILMVMERGVTNWNGKGMYTGQAKAVLLCAISRAEVAQLKAIIHEADPLAFVIIGQAQEVWGEGFRHLRETE
jgi:uncharacterized membrane-anchored protein YitT (DUF2179 family)